MDFLKKNWKTLAICLGFLLFAISVFYASTRLKGEDYKVHATLSLAVLMIYFWVFEAIPIYVTALFPLIFGSVLGIIDSKELSGAYGHNMVFLFLGGFLLAMGLEKWKIHTLVAQAIMNLVGTSKSQIILGILLSTCFLSMCVSNTATCLMMLPIAVALIEAIPSHERNGKFTKYLLLSVAYGSSIGGMGTLIGSPTNAVMASILSEKGIIVDFKTWMIYGIPCAIGLLLIVFTYFHLGLKHERHHNLPAAKLENISWNADRLKVVGIFGLVVLCWIFKDYILETGMKITDEGVALAGAAMMFLVPSSKKKPILEWKETEKLPWGVLLLFGGGLALAKMLENCGFVETIANYFSENGSFGFVSILIIFTCLAIFVTEIMSNTALVNILIPVIVPLGLSLEFSVTQLAIPVTLAASCAFMLPIGTPPNAIVFSSGYLKISDMIKIGILLNVLAVAFIVTFALLFIR